jgi:hypothetical protein
MKASSIYNEGRKLLLMGSSAYKMKELPSEIRERIDLAIENGVLFIVAEAHGSCRLFQDYLASKNYRDVVIGHAKSLRYNAGGWQDVKYGNNLKERERNMIRDCDYAIAIWQDNSSVIAENLEYLKKFRKSTFLFEYNSSDGTFQAGELDPRRSFRKLHPFSKSLKQKEKKAFDKWLSEKKTQ